METLSHLQFAAAEIERTFRKYGLSYGQPQYVVKRARRAAGLKPKRGRTGTVERLSAEEADSYVTNSSSSSSYHYL